MPQDPSSNLPQPSQTQGLAAAPQIEDIEIIKLLGQGGMSLVYKARQKTLDRIVAVKVLSNSAFRGEDGIKRFQKEAKLTSTLDHPNIVKTISFGVSEDRQPYLVMEYLEGLSLAEEFKQNGRLSMQKFKDVFLPTLSALNQAHQAGILHRDLKPANIMICSAQNGEKTVKLVDFGIAKVFGDGDTETQNLTKSGALMGSPTYMSPEQCLGKKLDGRSDLYSMACVMYESLSGEPPFSGESVLEVMQKHSSAPPPTVSELSRKIDIRKELANVTLWGLAKDPATRPQTASEFAKKLNEVLERITLDKVPKLRNSGETNYATLTKIGISVAVILPCIFMTAALISKSNKRMQEKTVATINSKLAHSSQTEERDFNRLLTQDVTTPGLAEKLETRAKTYEEQSNYARAEQLWKRAIEIEKKTLQPNDLDLAKSQNELGIFYFSQNRSAEAEPLFKQSLDIRLKNFRADEPIIANTLNALANCYHSEGKHAEAVAAFDRVLKIRDKNKLPDDIHTAALLEAFIISLSRENRLLEADAITKRLISFYEKSSGPNSMKVATSTEWMANNYIGRQMYAKAEPLLIRSLTICEKELGKTNPETIHRIRQIGFCYNEQAKYADAASQYKRLVLIEEKNSAIDIQTLTADMNSLADCYLKQHKIAEASSLTERIRALQQKTNR